MPGTAAALLVFSLAGVHVPLWIWILAIAAVPVALALAWDRYRGLGHAVLPATGDNPTWLITRNGSLDRDRDHLESPGIIGWTVRQSFFQRRGGVATIIAASAAGKKRYHIIDIPIGPDLYSNKPNGSSAAKLIVPSAVKTVVVSVSSICRSCSTTRNASPTVVT